MLKICSRATKPKILTECRQFSVLLYLIHKHKISRGDHRRLFGVNQADELHHAVSNLSHQGQFSANQRRLETKRGAR